MVNKLIRIASFLETRGQFDMADKVDDILVKIAKTSELNPFSKLVTQSGGQLMPQYGMVEYPNLSQSYRGVGAQRAMSIPDIIRSPQYQSLMRRIRKPVTADMSPQEQQKIMLDKHHAQRELSIYIAGMQGKQMQSYMQGQTPLWGRAYDVMRQQLQNQQKYMGQTVGSNPYQTGWFQGQVPSMYGMGSQVMQPWIVPQAASYYGG